MAGLSWAALRNLSSRERRTLAFGGGIAAVLFEIAGGPPPRRHVAQRPREVPRRRAEPAAEAHTECRPA